MGKRDPGCAFIQRNLSLNKLCVYVCFSWPVYSFLQYFDLRTNGLQLLTVVQFELLNLQMERIACQ